MRNMQSGLFQHSFSSSSSSDDDETDDEDSCERRPRSPLSPRFRYHAVACIPRRELMSFGSSSSSSGVSNGREDELIPLRLPGEDDISLLKRCVAVGFDCASEMIASAAATAPPPRPMMSPCWIKYYSSSHRILLVGDGDFSFSTCLAKAFGCASNMTATSLDSLRTCFYFLLTNYGSALENLMELKGRNCNVMHEIDATEMSKHSTLRTMKFERIIYNFPFAGSFKDLPRYSQLLRHRGLVRQFMKNAKEMLSENGEIHISHKTNGFFESWNLETLARSEGLRLIEAVDFNQVDYPGYNTKYGFGGDSNFNCSPSKTYKFGLQKLA